MFFSLILLIQTIIYCGFTIWATGLAFISTLNRTTPEQVIFMLLCGIGAGQARIVYCTVILGATANSLIHTQTQQTTIVAAQASVPRSEMSVVTAVRNVSYIHSI